MRMLTVAVYLICAFVLAVTELLARHSSARIPRLADLFRWMLRRRSAQIGIVMAWWWIGWHFLGSGA